MKKEGFTLIEVLVVIAIIGILSTIITPKVTMFLAKGKDAKVIATLSSLRTASELYYLENGKGIKEKDSEGNYSELNAGDLEKMKSYISGNMNIEENNEATKVIEQEIGGSRTLKDGEIKYGGKIKYTFATGEDADGIKIKIDATDVGEYTTNNLKWKDL